MRAAKNGSLGTGDSGTVVEISDAGTVRTAAGVSIGAVCGCSCAIQSILVVASKTADRMILMGGTSFDLELWGVRSLDEFQRSEKE